VLIDSLTHNSKMKKLYFRSLLKFDIIYEQTSNTSYEIESETVRSLECSVVVIFGILNWNFFDVILFFALSMLFRDVERYKFKKLFNNQKK
jgi:hypothetical protein